jgi:hypothetical protein
MNRKVIRVFTLVVSLFMTMTISSEMAAQNGPTQGDATFYYGGTWILHQDGWSPITMEIQRIGSEITGKASYDAGRNGIARGTVQGRAWSESYGPIFMAGVVTVDHFEVEIRWHDGVGIYHGTNMEKIPPRNSYEAELCGPGSSIRFDPGCAALIPRNSLAGETWPKGDPARAVNWHTDPVFLPLPPPVRSAPPPPTPIRSSGKMPKSEPAPPPPTPPFIIAGQPIIPTPAHPFGIVVIAWDGGPDHPNVEVVMSIDNGVEIPAFSMEQSAQSPVWKQPKMASIPLQLQRHHHYRFILRAPGQALSSVDFVVS